MALFVGVFSLLCLSAVHGLRQRYATKLPPWDSWGDNNTHCDKLVKGSVMRESSWRKVNECKCPENYVVSGTSPVCQKKWENYDRYFDNDDPDFLALPEGACECQELTTQVVQGSHSWWSCGHFNGVQTKTCNSHKHCCCVDGYYYNVQEHRCSVVTTTTTTTTTSTTKTLWLCDINSNALMAAELLLEKMIRKQTEDKDPLALPDMKLNRSEDVGQCTGPVEAVISTNLHGLSKTRMGPMTCLSSSCKASNWFGCSHYHLELEIEAYVEGSLSVNTTAQVLCGNGSSFSASSLGLQVVKPSMKTLVDLEFQVLPPSASMPKFKNFTLDWEAKDFHCKFGDDKDVSDFLCHTGGDLLALNSTDINFQHIIGDAIEGFFLLGD